MSHLIEEYSKNLEASPKKPKIVPHFFPIVYDRYITLDLSEKKSSKIYPYYEVVVSLIKNQLKKHNIHIIQIGDFDLLNKCDLNIDLDFKKTAYVISKSLLHIGPDNHLAQYASSVGVKSVTVFGNSFSKNTKPWWGNSICLEPNWDGKPCYSDKDPLQNIAKIKPEDIAKSILESLGLRFFNNFKTKFIGNQFNNKILEVIPSKNTQIVNRNIFIRVDYGFREDVFLELCKNNTASIISDRLIDLKSITNCKDNISKISLIIDDLSESYEESYKTYLSSIKSLGIEVVLLVDDLSNLNKFRNKFFDFPVFPKNKQTKEIDLLSSDLRFFSKKRIVEGDKIYFSYAHLLKKLDNNDKVLDTPEYKQEIEHFYIYEQ